MIKMISNNGRIDNDDRCNCNETINISVSNEIE